MDIPKYKIALIVGAGAAGIACLDMLVALGLKPEHILAFDREALVGCARVFPTEAQAGLVGYYSQFGFVAEGEEFLDTGVPHRAMRLTRGARR